MDDQEMAKELGYKLFQTEKNIRDVKELVKVLATQQLIEPLATEVLALLGRTREPASPDWLALKNRILDAPNAPSRLQILWENFAKDFGVRVND